MRNKKALDEVAEQSLKGANLWNEVKDRLDKPGGGLSGGQQQRLCIARAIAVQPDVLLMDEPCSALDPISTLAIEDLIAELKQDFTIVIVTHNMQQAARVSDQTAFFNLEATGKPGKLDRDRRHREDLLQPDARRPPRTTSRAASARVVSTTRVPDGSAVVHACSTSASGRACVLSCSSPAATISNSRGSASAAHAPSTSGGTLPMSDAGHGDAGAAQDARGQGHRRARHRADLDEPGGVVVRRRSGWSPARRARCSAGSPHR